MKTLSIVKACLGGGAAILLGGMLAAAPAAQASTGKAVPCKPAALIAAISAANSRGGGTINLAPGCTYRLTTVNNSNPTNPIVGANGLPVITTPVTINGAHTMIARSSSAPSFRLFEVDGPGGSLKLNNLTLTGGSSPAGGALLNAEGAVTLNHSRVIGNTAAMGGGGLASGVIDPNGVGPIGTLTLNFSQVTGNTALRTPNRMTCGNIGVHVVAEPRCEEGTAAAVDGAGRVMGADRAAAARRPEAG